MGFFVIWSQKKVMLTLFYVYTSSIWLPGLHGPRQANLAPIAYARCEGSDEPAHPRSLARIFAARSYKQ